MKNFISKLKKIVLVFLAILMLTLSLAPSAKAASTTSWYNQSFQDWFLRVYTGNDSEIFGERYTAAQVQWILYSLNAQVIGILVGNNMDVAACVIGKDVENCMDAIKTGLKDLFTYETTNKSFVATITSNPVSGVGYIRSVINKFRLVPEAQAQEGFGFNATSPVLKVWKVSRDVTYSLLVIVIIVFAFMIMFRVKINPQTVISVQSALPKIVMAMVLITFSYAIAGLIIDFMYVLIGLIAAIITQSGLSNFKFSQLLAAFLNRNLFTIYVGYWEGFFLTAISAILSQETFFLGIGAFLFSLVLSIILLVQSFKGIFALLKNYAMLLIAIMTGPFEILFGTLNSSGGFGAWLMKIISYTVVYPVITVIVFMAHFFLAQALRGLSGDFAESLAYNPAILIEDTTWHIPFSAFEFNGMRIMWMAVSYMLIIMIPKVFDIIKSFMERKPFDYGTAIGQSFSPIANPIGSQVESYRRMYGEYSSRGFADWFTSTKAFDKLATVPGVKSLLKPLENMKTSTTK